MLNWLDKHQPVTSVTHEDPVDSQRAWISIPIFTKDQLPGLPYEIRLQLLDKAQCRSA
jgi:hypothetical protein